MDNSFRTFAFLFICFALAGCDSGLSNRDLPSTQSAFLRIVDGAADGSRRAANDLQRNDILSKRNQDICALFSAVGDSFSDWLGTVDSVRATRAGKGAITVRLSSKAKMGTWNNAFSDGGANTLIESGTAVFESLKNIREGDRVSISGRFVLNRNDCVREKSLRLRTKLESPDFVVQITGLRKQ